MWKYEQCSEQTIFGQRMWMKYSQGSAQCILFIKVCPTKTENVMLSKHYNNS